MFCGKTMNTSVLQMHNSQVTTMPQDQTRLTHAEQMPIQAEWAVDKTWKVHLDKRSPSLSRKMVHYLHKDQQPVSLL